MVSYCVDKNHGSESLRVDEAWFSQNTLYHLGKRKKGL